MARAGISGPQACPKGLRHAFRIAAIMLCICFSATLKIGSALGVQLSGFHSRCNAPPDSLSGVLRPLFNFGDGGPSSWWVIREPRTYNAIRPHGSLAYRPPAPETIVFPSWLSDSTSPAIQFGRETGTALIDRLRMTSKRGPGMTGRGSRLCLRLCLETPGCRFSNGLQAARLGPSAAVRRQSRAR